MRYCFAVLVTHSANWWLELFYLSCVSHSLLELPVHAQHTIWLCFNFQVSFSQPVPCFFFICCFWDLSYKLSIHSFVFQSFLLFPHPTLFEFLLIHCIVIFWCFCSFSLLINGSTEFLTNHHMLFSSLLIHPSQFLNLLPPISLLRYTLSTSPLECSTSCIVMNFLVLLSKLFNSSVFHFRTPAPYLIIDTAQALIAVILFLPFNFNLNISLNRCRYSLLNFS